MLPHVSTIVIADSYRLTGTGLGLFNPGAPKNGLIWIGLAKHWLSVATNGLIRVVLALLSLSVP